MVGGEGEEERGLISLRFSSFYSPLPFTPLLLLKPGLVQARLGMANTAFVSFAQHPTHF